jgi:mono/diheme cytochrome c family protein
MRNALMVISALLLVALLVTAQNTPTASKPANTPYYTIPLEAANRENPIKATSESLARGKKQYGYDCTMCHGKDGNGKGDVAADLKLTMHDATDPATLKGRTDGELFYIIQHGKDAMPPEGNRVKAEIVWDMVNYVRSFSKKGAPAPEKPADDKATEEKAPN